MSHLKPLIPGVRWCKTLLLAGGFAAAVAALCTTSAAAQPKAAPYRLGVSAMLTGPVSSFYAAQAEGLRVFFDQVNAAGGVDGHPVDVEFRDNRGDPATAAADAQTFIDGNTLTATLFSASNTVPGFAQAVTRAGVPTVNASWCYGPSVPGGGPKIAKSYFCAGFSPLANVLVFVGLFDKFAKTMGPHPHAAYAGTDAPGNVVAFTKMFIPMVEHHGWEKGGYLAAVPFSTTDYSPAARAIIGSGAQAVNVYCPADCTLQFVRALRAAGFKGPITAVLASSEPAFRALKDPELYLVVNTSLIAENKPVHQKIVDAAKRFHARASAGDLLDGWLVGMVIEKGLKTCGFPCTREKLMAIFNDNFTLDSQDAIDLIGGKISWTPSVHYLKVKAFRVVHWSTEKQQFVDFGAPITVEDPGLVFPKF